VKPARSNQEGTGFPQGYVVLEIRVAPYRFGCVYAPGEEIALEAAGDGEEITWESADFFGRVTAEGKGPASKTAVSLPTNRQG